MGARRPDDSAEPGPSWSGPATVGQLIRNASAEFGSADYVVTPDKRLSFEDADKKSEALATHLVAAGIGKGAHVGFVLPQGPDWIVAFLAITRIGALAVPLSTFLRPRELQVAIEHTDLHVLLVPTWLHGVAMADRCEEALPGLVAAVGPTLHLAEAPMLRRIWMCGAGGPAWSTGVAEVMASGAHPEVPEWLIGRMEKSVFPSDLMAMIHTSGATAGPKAVVHTHGAQIRHSAALADLYEIPVRDRTFTSMPFFWVGGLTVTLLSHLHVGATVITVERLDAATTIDLIEEWRPSRILGWGLLERLENDPGIAGRELGWVRELLPRNQVRPGTRHNSLGMTETSGPHTMARASENTEDLPEACRGSFGPPIAGVEHQIVDPDTGEPLPPGSEGVICVRGYSVMAGIHREERVDTFDADGWYVTGDRGAFRDGLLFFTGRTTEMIKTNGANVAPAEVEREVIASTGAKAAFVVGISDGKRGESVACVVCPHGNQEIDPAQVQADLRERLSGYKVPRVIRVVDYDDLPWLPSGKLSKPRLIELLADAG